MEKEKIILFFLLFLFLMTIYIIKIKRNGKHRKSKDGSTVHALS